MASDLRNLILAEIRRLAAEQGGKPPGKQRFSTATGISEGSWNGKYWARWGDALSEAGFAANLKMEKYDSASLLDAVIAFVLELGRMPTTAEIKMRRATNPDFPWHSTLSNHYPSRSLLIKALRDRAHEQKNNDVLRILPETPSAPNGHKATQPQDGLVYLLRWGTHYKIGRSSNIERRIKEIALALPETATLIHAIKTDDPAGIEAYWHRRFESKRANGEWFALNADDVRAFCARKVQ